MCIAQLSEQNATKDFNDDEIYGAIGDFLKVKYPDETILQQCMIKTFRVNKIADNFSTLEFKEDHAWIQDSIEPHEKVARIKCNIAVFFSSSPFGILIMVGFLLIVILLLCCLIKCIWC